MAKSIGLFINGLNVQVTPYRVMIMDELGDVTNEEAKLIVKYLHAEGFITKTTIICEIINPND